MRLLITCFAVFALACDAAPGARAEGDTALPRASGAPAEVPSTSPAPGAVRPVFEADISPGEGIPVFEAVAGTLPLWEQPYPGSRRVAEPSVTPGERLSYDSTRYQTIEPARLRVLAPTTLAGRMLGALDRLTRDDYYSRRFDRVEIAVDTSDRLELLQHRAEGTCFVRHEGRVLDAQRCPAFDSDAFVLERQPVTQWWIRVTRPDGTAGWAQVDDRLVRYAGRRW